MSVSITKHTEDRFKLLRHHKREAKRHFLKIGEQLYYLKDEYADYGFESFNALIADPEIDIKRTTAYMLKGIYEDFILGLNYEPVRLLDSSPSKLELIRPHITEENKDELLSLSDTLSRSDLGKEVHRLFGKPETRNTFPDKIKLIKSILFDACPDATSNYQRMRCIEMNKAADAILRDYDNTR